MKKQSLSTASVNEGGMDIQRKLHTNIGGGILLQRLLRASRGVAVGALCLLTLASCSYSQFAGVATGSSLGGMFGSSIGGLMNGPYGSDKGTLAGMIIGGAIGAAATAPRQQKAETNYNDDTYAYQGGTSDGGVQYGTYNNPRYRTPAAEYTDVAHLSVENIHFLDENNNQRLDEGEQAFIVFDIYNGSQTTLYNIAPQITCNNRRVVISPAATIASLAAGKGVRYKAAVRSTRRIDQSVTYTISFGNGKQRVVAKTFRI